MARIQTIRYSVKPHPQNRLNTATALQTGWEPVESGRSSSKSQTLIIETDRMLFRPSWPYKIGGLALLLAGLAAVYGGLANPFEARDIARGVMSCFGILWIGLGLFLMFAGSNLTFDKGTGRFYSGNKDRSNSTKPHGALAHIHALQILHDFDIATGDGHHGPYRAYELNLVLNHGKRLHVLEQGNLPDLQRTALKLGQFLGVPVWQAHVENMVTADSSPAVDPPHSGRETPGIQTMRLQRQAYLEGSTEDSVASQTSWAFAKCGGQPSSPAVSLLLKDNKMTVKRGGLDRLISFTNPYLTFDKNNGRFFVGASWEKRWQARASGLLSDIYAVQIISKSITSSTTNPDTGVSTPTHYRSSELNLVFKNSKRLHVIPHGNLAELEQIANTLADFLGVAVWRLADEYQHWTS